MRTRWTLPFLLMTCGLAVRAEGHEIAVSLCATPLKANAPYPETDHRALGLQVRWDAASNVGNRDQWVVSCVPPPRKETIQYGFVGVGYALGAVSRNEIWFAALGSEVRLERITSEAMGSTPATMAAPIVRPWVTGTVGFKGLLLPLPYFEIVNYYVTRSNRIYPFTRVEVACPLLRTGGKGPEGALARTTNALQASLQMGMRF